MAWLNASPKIEGNKDSIPRRVSYVEGSPQLEMISLSAYEQHILEKWYEAGTVAQGAGGLLPLDWNTIIPWASHFYSEEYIEWVEHPRPDKRYKVQYTPVVMKQCTLLDAELQLIRRMSQDYANEYAEASDPARACPKEIIVEDVPEDVAMANANAMAEAFKQMFGSQDDVTSVEEVKNQ
jgi:hypothetical protein